MSILKRIGSILKTGLLWAMFWVPVSLLRTFTGFHEAWSLLYLFKLTVAYAVVGFITGSAFGAVISLTEAGRPFSRLKGWRMALWGGIAALAFPAAWWLLSDPNPWRFAHVGLFLLDTGVAVVAGVGCAAAMFGLARRAERLSPRPEPPMLPRSAE